MVQPMVKVLFIAGWQRSGTTVAGNVLGSIPGAMHIGELHYLWMKQHPAGFECGCGRIIFDCPAWKPVFDELSMTTEKRYAIRQLRRDHWRNDDVPARFREWRRGRVDLAYPRAVAELYGALVASTGASVVVDSTKNASDALAVSLAPGVDMHLLHVVRDPRAAAYSGMQEKVHGSDASGLALKQFSATRNTFHWDVRNLLIERRVKPTLGEDRYRRVRYEDLMASPREAFGEIADWVGLDPASMPFTGDSSLRMVQSHTVMGNPNRHVDGETSLRTDSRWVDKLGGRDRVVVNALAAPLMVRYGYPLRSASAKIDVAVNATTRD
jgi:hypothetical protein